MEAPDLTARVSVRIHVSGDGRVSDVSIVPSPGGSTRLRNCLSGAIGRWTFPAPAGGAPAVVPYTFVFE
jgi:TonB family protein